MQIVGPLANAQPAAQRPAPRGEPGTTVVVVDVGDHLATLASVASVQEHSQGTAIVVAAEVGNDFGLRDRLSGRSADALVTVPAGGSFAARANRGIERALAGRADLEHVLVLAGGARLRPGALTAMRACAAHHGKAGVIVCRIVGADGELWCASGRFPRLSPRRFAAPTAGATEHEVEYVTECCMLVDAGMLRRGLRFDELFRDCGADADLCRRVQDLGRSLWVTLAATVELRHGALPADDLAGEPLFWLTRARALLARKHFAFARRLAFWTLAWLGAPLAGIVRRRAIGWLGPYLRGLWAGASTRVERAARPAAAPGAPGATTATAAATAPAGAAPTAMPSLLPIAADPAAAREPGAEARAPADVRTDGAGV